MQRSKTQDRDFAECAHLTIYVRCVEPPAAHPEWKDKEWLRLDDPAMCLNHNESCWRDDYDKLRQRWLNAANRIARKIMANEGGVWVGRVRDASNDPRPDRVLSRVDREAADKHILNGPDGPGRRFLADLRGKPDAGKLAALAASLKSVPRTSARDMVERLKQPAPVAPGPVWFDPDNDPALREPGESE